MAVAVKVGRSRMNFPALPLCPVIRQKLAEKSANGIFCCNAGEYRYTEQPEN